jgi:UDP:flavonoid glycosyltransferase YjiC (YdhE family)
LTPLRDADLCITYGAEGTTLRFLLAGVPQLIVPWHVETYMAARRIEALGCGLALTGSQTSQSVTERVGALCVGGEYRLRAQALSESHRGDSCEETVREITSAIDVDRCHDVDGPVGRYGVPPVPQGLGVVG